MSDRGRYVRQRMLPEVGPDGQARLEAGAVEIRRTDLAGFVCARYLVGAGVGCLRVPPALLKSCRDLRADVRCETVEPLKPGEPGPWIRVGRQGWASEPGTDPMVAGSEGARWALMTLLSEKGPS